MLNPIKINVTPTMLVFKGLTDEESNVLYDEIGIKWSDKGYYYIKGNEKELYKVILKLSYKYDLEIY